MKLHLKGLIAAFIAIIFTFAGSMSAFAATGGGGDGEFHFTIVNSSFAYGEPEVSLESESRTLVNGNSTQLTWWYPNHNIKVSKASLKKAPRIKVKYTKCATQSKSIAKQAHGASVVIAMPGSTICNTGKNGNIVGGFKWTVKVPAVLKWNKSLKLYEHVYNIVGGKLKKTCGNRMGGHVDVMYANVTQVRYEEDVLLSAKAVAKSGVTTETEFGVTCPNGAYFKVKASGFANGLAEAAVTYTKRTRESVRNAQKAALKNETHVDGEGKAVTNARNTLDVSGSCGGTPPTTYQGPAASGSAKACVKPGQQNGVIIASGSNPNAVAAPGTLTIGGQTKQFTSVGAGQTVSWEFSGFAPGNYSGSFTLGAPINKSVPIQVTVEACPAEVHKNPLAELYVGEHAVDYQGTMPVFGRVKAFDGATAVLGSPTVTPNDLGMISNWRPVSTERDGVTPCESGWVCYQGTFRVTKTGAPGTYAYGTLVGKATDNQGGEFTTQPLSFSVYYANHPET